MASLTIRKLDDAIRDELRLRAARNGRSVEDEVRVILREASQHRPPPAVSATPEVSRVRSDADAGLPRVTLIIGGGIAAYKALDLIRRLKERHVHVRCVLTRAAQQFVTPLTASALSNERCYTDLFDPESEFDAGHIRLARDCALIGPNAGEMAEAGEAGVGRMAEPPEIASTVERLLRPPQPRPLAGKRILITAGPTHEPIDPVRYIANRSSGKQGFAIAVAAQRAGADVTLISGPVDLDDPAGVTVKHVESARDMLHRVEAALPVDIAIFAAAVADWRVANEGEQKLKKTSAGMPPLQLIENPDILATIAKLQDRRPGLVIGFAAETENLVDNAKAKLARKGCDWIVANDVSPASGVMGGDRNTVHLLARDDAKITVDSWPVMSKEQVAAALVARIASTVLARTPENPS